MRLSSHSKSQRTSWNSSCGIALTNSGSLDREGRCHEPNIGNHSWRAADDWNGLHGGCIHHCRCHVATCPNQMVNWDIATERLHETTASIETGWNRLKSSFRSL